MPGKKLSYLFLHDLEFGKGIPTEHGARFDAIKGSEDHILGQDQLLTMDTEVLAHHARGLVLHRHTTLGILQILQIG